jgi:hypothetical protein
VSHTGMTWPKTNITVSEGETEVTARGLPLNIETVRYLTEQMLTKRRAVDFCRLAASLCRMA